MLGIDELRIHFPTFLILVYTAPCWPQLTIYHNPAVGIKHGIIGHS